MLQYPRHLKREQLFRSIRDGVEESRDGASAQAQVFYTNNPLARKLLTKLLNQKRNNLLEWRYTDIVVYLYNVYLQVIKSFSKKQGN